MPHYCAVAGAWNLLTLLRRASNAGADRKTSSTLKPDGRSLAHRRCR